MKKNYKKPVLSASPDIRTAESKISPLVAFLIKIFGRLYLFLFFGVTRILPHKEKTLYEAFERALSGKSRLIIAFRHPNGGEPQLLTWFFLFRLKSHARKYGVRYKLQPHTVFLYGYEVVRWGGWVPRIILPGVGALPIYHSKMDTKGMSRIYGAITNGPYPIAIAPEGQVSYTADSVTRLEPGVVRIGFYAAEHLEKKNPDCPVEVLPLSIHFRFGSWGKGTVEFLLRHIEKFCGFKRKEKKNLPFHERLKKCRDYILKINEERYNLKNDDSLSFEERIEKVANAALETAEQMLNLKAEGDFFMRQHKVRQICWDRIFIPDIYNFKELSPVKRSVMDLKAGEAWYIARHEELANLCWYLRIKLPAEETPLHNKIEYTQNLHDFANRTMGGAFSNRVSIFPRRVIIKTAPAINLTERLPAYRKTRKAEIAKTLADLEKAYLDNINEMNLIEQG